MQQRLTYWDDFARSFQRWEGPRRHYQKRLPEIFSFAIPPGARVLEFGSGCGDLLAALRPARGVGVDLSPLMVELARERDRRKLQTNRRPPRAAAKRFFSIPNFPTRAVFFQVLAIDSGFHTLASRTHGADEEFAITQQDALAGVLKKRPLPALLLQTPRTHEHAVVHNDHPDANEPVLPLAGSNVQALGFTQSPEDVIRGTPVRHRQPR